MTARTPSTAARAHTAKQPPPPQMLLVRARVAAVQRLSPNFVRITFAAAQLNDFGTPGHSFDQRIKLIFPAVSGKLPELQITDENWYQSWLALPEAERGVMRTYSVRDLLRVPNGEGQLVVDFVLHGCNPGHGAETQGEQLCGEGSRSQAGAGAPIASGPAASWAAAARIGDELLLLGPRQGVLAGGGIEYAPGAATRVLLAGDETAAPAIARILEDVAQADAKPQIAAFIEVPSLDDRLPIAAPAGAQITWLARERDDAAPGSRLIPAVLAHLGYTPEFAAAPPQMCHLPSAEPVWETPGYSGLGEPVTAARNHAEAYFWIAGESGAVTGLRRHLVRELSIARQQVAFMGYWRQGVAMRV